MAFMTLTPYLYTEKLIGTPAIVWERETREHVAGEIKKLNVYPELIDLTVDADIAAQVPPSFIDYGSFDGQEGGESNGVRSLQQNSTSPPTNQNSTSPQLNNSLIIEFNVALSYRSIIKDHQLEEYVFSAWDSEAKKAAYLKRLKKSDYYSDVEEIQVEVQGFIPRTLPPQPEDDEGLGLWIIVGASVGGGAFLILCIILICRSRNKNISDEGNDRTKASSVSHQRIAA